MWSKTERRPGWRFATLFLLITCSCSTWACAKPASVCPKRSHAHVQQIDVFDGKPEDQAFLAPDDPDRAPDIYTLAEIYDQGRTVTVRCHYDNGPAQDVELKTRTQTCRFIPESKRRSMDLVCR